MLALMLSYKENNKMTSKRENCSPSMMGQFERISYNETNFTLKKSNLNQLPECYLIILKGKRI